MTVDEILNNMKIKARADETLRSRLLATRHSGNPLGDFCAICAEYGFPLSVMDLIEAGEADYAAIKRSTNGGGENSPVLDGEDDYYEMFLAELAR